MPIARIVMVAACAAALIACQQTNGVMGEIAKQEAVEKKAKENSVADGLKLLETNKARPGVQVTASGLQYEIVRAGDEKLPKPSAADEVLVHYEGTLPSGKVFDSSYERGQPIGFPLGGVIPGWTEGVQLMHPGSEFRFVIPSDLAYGPEGAGGDIGPNQVLVFKVELIAFRRASDGKIFPDPATLKK
jgi:FKBP-type peptidyl-prolyl cis-trans isomerase FkpA/FKBP-type peptidyl-prolyl cis-trans isomerase FklB